MKNLCGKSFLPKSDVCRNNIFPKQYISENFFAEGSTLPKTPLHLPISKSLQGMAFLATLATIFPPAQSDGDEDDEDDEEENDEHGESSNSTSRIRPIWTYP